VENKVCRYEKEIENESDQAETISREQRELVQLSRLYIANLADPFVLTLLVNIFYYLRHPA
jgi:hypothetical protein